MWATRSSAAAALAKPPQQAHFLEHTLPTARAWAAQLARGIRVRDCTSLGCSHLIRIATRRPQENIMLLRALRDHLPPLC